MLKDRKKLFGLIKVKFESLSAGNYYYIKKRSYFLGVRYRMKTETYYYNRLWSVGGING